MDELEQIKEQVEQIRLTDAERSHMRTVLISHMHKNPAMIASPFWGLLSPLGLIAIRQGAFALSLLILVGGGTTIAAEGALPGGTLYGLKIGVVEPVRGAFAVGEEAQATWHAELASRRLAEIDDLVVSDTVSTEVRAEAAARVAYSATVAAEKIDVLAKKNEKKAGKAAVKLERALAAHSVTLRVLQESGDASSTPVLRAAADIASAPSAAAAAFDARAMTAAKAPEATTMLFSTELGLGGAGDATLTKEEEDDKREYDRATQLFERTREIAGNALLEEIED